MPEHVSPPRVNLDLVDALTLGAEQCPVLVLYPVIASPAPNLRHADPGVSVEELTVEDSSSTLGLLLTEQILEE